MQALTSCGEHAHTRSVQGSVQGGNGPLHAWVRFGAKLTLGCHDTPQTVSIPLGKCHRGFKKANTLHHRCRSSCNVQPSQLDRPTSLYLNDPPRSHGIEHHSPRHLRFDGQGAVDADRRSGAHVAGKLVCARCQQDLVDRAVCYSCGELAHCACRHFVQMPTVQCHVQSGRPHDGADDQCAWRAQRGR